MWSMPHCNHSYHRVANLSYSELSNHAYMEPLNERITRLRNERGLSQRDLAMACNVSHVAVGKWENGLTENLKLANLVALAKFFGMSAGQLLGEEKEDTGASAIASRALSDDESKLIAAFRAGDATARDLMMAQANAVLSHSAQKKRRSAA